MRARRPTSPPFRRYRASARHWTAEAMEEHRQMGFEQGWNAVADQFAALAEGRC